MGHAESVFLQHHRDSYHFFTSWTFFLEIPGNRHSNIGLKPIPFLRDQRAPPPLPAKVVGEGPPHFTSNFNICCEYIKRIEKTHIFFSGVFNVCPSFLHKANYNLKKLQNPLWIQ